MKRTRDPRANKDKDLSSHCRNCYGENPAASRRGIRIKKRVTARRSRRDESHLLSEIARAKDIDDDDCSNPVRRKAGCNQKWPDQPLEKVLARRTEWVIWKSFFTTAGTMAKIERFIAWSAGHLKIPAAKQESWRRFLRALQTGRYGQRSILTAAGLTELRQAVATWTRRA